MPLPMTKGDFNRLGDRLISSESPSEADLEDLASVLAVYQEVLEQIKVHLRDLGFASGARVKTTTTMTDKLRRDHGMELSRMQDLAGARITVRNFAGQDEARDKISEFYAAQGCRLRVIDRRTDPRFGYRAVHLVVYVDELPVEIQIRTELQDSWAQIVERLGDRWGRGIRYGLDPENPEGIIRYGESTHTRRELLSTLMTLSDIIFTAEGTRQRMYEIRQGMLEMDSMWQEQQSGGSLKLPASKIRPGLIPLGEMWTGDLSADPGGLDAEARELLAIPVADLTNAQFRRIVDIDMGRLKRREGVTAARVADAEQQLRDILQLIAGATDEGA
jgi:ppGpp synthetase/RelA/SpoT-type nucleotidyltranferase